jgi:hypothetical protein
VEITGLWIHAMIITIPPTSSSWKLTTAADTCYIKAGRTRPRKINKSKSKSTTPLVQSPS